MFFVTSAKEKKILKLMPPLSKSKPFTTHTHTNCQIQIASFQKTDEYVCVWEF